MPLQTATTCRSRSSTRSRRSSSSRSSSTSPSTRRTTCSSRGRRPRPPDQRRRAAVDVGVQLPRRRRRSRRADDVFEHRHAGQTCRRCGCPVDESVRFELRLARRHPLVLGAGVLLQDGRRPRARQQLRPDARPVRARSPAGAPSCAALYHSRMLFKVKVVSADEYDAAPGRLQARGQHGLALRWPDDVDHAGRPRDRTRRKLSDHRLTPTHGRRPARPPVARRTRWARRSCVVITTTDHKVIGKLYLGHVVRVLPRRRPHGAGHARRAGPRRACRSSTTSSTTSCSRCTARSCCCCSRRRCSSASPTSIMPLQIGSPDVAFPRLNMFSYWLFLFGGLIARLRLPDPRGRRRLRLVRATRRCPTR